MSPSQSPRYSILLQFPLLGSPCLKWSTRSAKPLASGAHLSQDGGPRPCVGHRGTGSEQGKRATLLSVVERETLQCTCTCPPTAATAGTAAMPPLLKHRLGQGLEVSCIGLGTMGSTAFYGKPPEGKQGHRHNEDGHPRR